MASLERNLRKDLEKVVKQARRVAEAGARNAVAQLGVGEAESPKHLSAEQRALRKRLRAHGRQLGDRRDPKTGFQDTARLVQECAYEHWHRTLFARFLAETGLLIEPESSVAITLDEVQEFAREKATDWLELASDYAERMLPQIFRKEDPVLSIVLPPETRSEMEDLLKGLSKPVFEADDGLGWVYQFWQADKKDEVNKSEAKIGADELPAVTQLFTEDYMVLFLLHNTLGAWWAGKVLSANSSLAASAPDEATLRAACTLGGIEWTYLRFVREKAEDGSEGPWHPAAGTFDGWPKTAKELTILDPCMGSGHFLVFALPILVAFRMTEEGLSQAAAVDAVLKNNLFGLEIDPRCTQIAVINLALAAWRRVGYRPLPQLNLACSGLAIGVTKSEWLRLAEKAVTVADPATRRDFLGVDTNLLTVGLEERVKNGLEALYDLFAKAPWLGSLIDPRRAGADIFREGFGKLEPLLASILAAADADEAREMAVTAQGMAKAAETLRNQFALVLTNVPYLGRSRQDSVLFSYCDEFYPRSKADLATAFLERCISLTLDGGACGIVCTQSWFYLTQYTRLRRDFIASRTINTIGRLGSGAFESIGGEVVSVALIIASPLRPVHDHVFRSIDASAADSPLLKSISLQQTDTLTSTQAEQANNPDARIVLGGYEHAPLLSAIAEASHGQGSFDSPRFSACFWEVAEFGSTWEFQQSTPNATKILAGCHFIFRWEGGKGSLADLMAAKEEDGYASGKWKAGVNQWGKIGILCGQMGDMPCTIYLGMSFDENASVIIPNEETDLPYLWAYCSSNEFRQKIRTIDQSVKITCKTLVKVAFERQRWEPLSTDIMASLTTEIDDITEWVFSGAVRAAQNPLQAAVARLVGFRWPRQKGVKFPFVKEIIGVESTHVEHDDGIVCLAPLKGEPPAELRLIALLTDEFDREWSAAKLASLLAEAGYAGKSLDDWLRDGFFAQHCELFHQRPFIWHFWDGRRDGFHALVNYHRLAAPNGEGRRTLEKLIYSYLGDWIDRQRAGQRAGVEGADARLVDAESLKAELIKILEGEPPYDIFVRWKPLHEQPVGWDPDINDGVRINIRPFMTARPLIARGANAGILRAMPKIKWDKDRGKEPTREKADYPWFWSKDAPPQDFGGDSEFHGNRWNDLHYSCAVKEAARDRHRLEAGAGA